MSAAVGTHRVLRAMRYYPPYFGARIRVTRADARLREIEVEMKLSAWNRNYVGTHFGGSLYSMCDPFYAKGFRDQTERWAAFFLAARSSNSWMNV